MIAVLGPGGILCGATVEGPVNGDLFEAFVTRVLVDHLRPGDVVVRDNLSSHKRASTIQRIEATGAIVRFLPPYSPGLNPIEPIFSKVKQRLRSLASRSREALWATVQSVLDTVTPNHARNCIRHCGYTLQTR